MQRRTLLKSSLFGAGFGLAGGLSKVTLIGAAANGSSSITPVVETTSGKVRGVLHAGVHTFRGIPYGASTAGANRFLPPRKTGPWTGVRDAFQNGHSSPQVAPAPSAIGAGLRGYAAQGEDCLVLNVFSNGVSASGDNKKRPVMMWIHGGGYTYGSGGSLGYDGGNLARNGDVVVVCINHRLNIVGHLFLGHAGSVIENSGNAGMLDIVAALQWVRDNIASFGGDPGNVTIFGQSGGGGKVSTLLAMPSAKGLFHKAIVESGSTLKQMTKDEARQTTDKVMAALGTKSPAELQQVPIDKLLAAMGSGTRFGPVVDGSALPHDPFDPEAPVESLDVPMLVGTTETEGSYFAPPELLSMDEAAARARLRDRLQGDGDRIYDLFRSSRPKATPSELYFTISAFPTSAHVQVERKAAKAKAPAYLYQIRWRTPVEGGRRLSPHCIEIPFAMQNHWQLPEMVGTGPELQPLADKVSGAWIAFARTGNPNHAGIPKWTAYSSADRTTMIVDNEWKAMSDPNREERIAMATFTRLPMF
ncbi:MAG TPA: carboxylesterase family protein [Vicinamibacterales bacterium]|nr:carboxylesterase family protein [Vicinamibacterales bacterium]